MISIDMSDVSVDMEISLDEEFETATIEFLGLDLTLKVSSEQLIELSDSLEHAAEGNRD